MFMKFELDQDKCVWWLSKENYSNRPFNLISLLTLMRIGYRESFTQIMVMFR